MQRRAAELVGAQAVAAAVREPLVRIGIARRAVAIGAALVVDGEGLRNRRGQQPFDQRFDTNRMFDPLARIGNDR